MTMKTLGGTLLCLLALASVSAADTTSVTKEVKGRSVKSDLYLYKNTPSIVTITGDQIIAAFTNTEWLRLETDVKRNFVGIVFIGDKRPTKSGGITILGENCHYFLSVAVTDIEKVSAPFRHFHYVKLGPQPKPQPSRPPMPATTKKPDRLEADILDGRATVARRVGPNALSVHLQLAFGALWSHNAIVANREATTLAGVGVSVRKGITPMFAIDAGGLIATSGEAGFRGVAWNGSQGELVQTTRLARLDVGGRLRLGSEIVPTVRVGVGLEGAWSQFRFFDGSARRFGPGDEVDWRVFVSLSAGFDLAIGNRVTSGAALSAAGRRSIDGSLHIGYRP